MPKLAALLLSAGHSSRMGQPKALLEWQQRPLIKHQLETLRALNCPIAVVLGANEEAISTVLKDEEVLRVSHARFDAGMGSSIAAGISAIRPLQPEAVLIVAVDQPLITATYLKALVDFFHQNPNGIVQSTSTEGWKGIPAIFSATYFDELEGLDGDFGAKPVVKKHFDDCLAYAPSALLADMDTYAQYEALKKATPQS